MKKLDSYKVSFTRFLMSSVLLASSISIVSAANPNPGAATKTANEKANQATRAEARTESNEKATEKRKEVLSEAVSTLRETQDALAELDAGKTKEALSSLERATGKLEIVLAREPRLALLPVAVRMVSTDIYATIDTVKAAKLQAEKQLREGQVQAARALLQHLASETIVSTTNLPVATYPGALKKAAKLIDENKVPDAKQVLQTAMDTLVVTEVVIPMPVARAKAYLAKADELAKLPNRTAPQNKQLTDLVTAADTAIKFAEELGYGKKTDFDSFHKEIESIRAKTGSGKSGNGLFDQIKSFMDSMNKNSQHPSGNSK